MSCKASLRLSTVSKVVNLNAKFGRNIFAKMRAAGAAPRAIDLNSPADARVRSDFTGFLIVGVRIAALPTPKLVGLAF